MRPRQQYRVVGHYVTVQTRTINGAMVVGLHKGMLIPGDVKAATIDHLLSVKLIEPFGDMPGVDTEQYVDTSGSEADEPTDRPGTTTPIIETTPDVDDEVESRRAEARAKLPTDGTLPTKRHGQQVWAEAAVLRGYDRAAAEAATKDELVDLLAGAV